MARTRLLAAAVAVAVAAVGQAAVAASGGLGPPPPRFAPYDLYQLGVAPVSAVIADFTGDGKADVAVATGFSVLGNADANKVVVFAQTAGGRLTRHLTLDTTAPFGYLRRLATADVDGDGDADLLLPHDGGIDLYTQVAGGVFLPTFIAAADAFAFAVDVADLNGDGKPDLVLSTGGGVSVRLAMTPGHFGPPTVLTDYYYQELELGDVTGDGLVDVVGWTGILIRVHIGRGDGTFVYPAEFDPPGDDGSGMTLGDFNGDGRTDAAVTYLRNTPKSVISFVLQQPNGRLLSAPASVPIRDLPEALRAGDVNLDGRTDLVVAHSGWQEAGVVLQRKDGTFGPEFVFPLPYSSSYELDSLAVGDVSGDGLPDIAVADGANGLVVLRSAAQAQVWGLAQMGQLGNGSTADRAAPAVVPADLGPVAALAAGGYHNLAVVRDGTVWAWGLNNAGQLGDGSAVNRSRPVQVSGLTDVSTVAAGTVHSAAIRSDGTLWTWGWNGFGQLGLGTGAGTGTRSVPTQVPGLSGVIAVAAGLGHTVALTSDGSVWTWGLNHVGQLGNGTNTDSAVPVKVPGISGARAIAAGAYHTLIIGSDGYAWSWGLNQAGQLGTGSTALYETTPQRSMWGAQAIAAGAYHSVAIGFQGSVWAWGLNTEGEVGDGTGQNRLTPTYLKDHSEAHVTTAITAGWFHTVAVADDGTTFTWGWNHFGQLGVGTTENALSPVAVPGLAPVAIAAGVAHTVAFTARG